MRLQDSPAEERFERIVKRALSTPLRKTAKPKSRKRSK